MPNHIKAILTVLVFIVAVVSYFFQAAAGQEVTQWLVLGLGAFMIATIWLFPEAGNKDSKR
ncbi:hypothetical protein [Marinobacter salarius]